MPSTSTIAPSELDVAAHLAKSATCVFTTSLHAEVSDENGLLFSCPVALPAWSNCVYYAPFQRHAINPDLDLWPEGYNQCHPLPLADLAEAKRGGLFALFELADGDFLALLPLVGMRSAAWLRGDGEGLRLDAGHFGAGGFDGELPLLACARDNNLYAACARSWEAALAHPSLHGVGRLRRQKTYPEVFAYLGWCSFEEFKLAIDEKIIVNALKRLAASPVPVRWALIDDGHIDDASRATDALLETQEGALGQVSDSLHARRLHDARPHPEKFPHGWAPVTATAAADPRLQWLGLWLNFNGYWGGIAPDHKLGADVGRHLVALGDGSLLPGEKPGDGPAFYDALTRPVREAGFDFIKVDNQAANLRKYADAATRGGRIQNAVAAAAGCRHALEQVVAKHFDAIIGCMAHNNLCGLHQPVSQVMRCSEDYKKEDAWRARHHLHNSFGNMLWLGQTAWGDHDMFHSSDRMAGPLMARSKAISGGPVYLSDHPDHFVRELIAPLHLSDGRLLRPLAPAVPAPESVFIDPYESDRAYRVVAPLAHGCAALAAYNLTHPAKTVSGQWTAADLRHAAALLSADEAAVWHGSDDRSSRTPEVLLYDCIRRTARVLDHPQAFALAPLTDTFVILSPIIRGWALIGHPDKYLPPSFVTEFVVSPDSVRISTAEAGHVWLWRSPESAALVSDHPLVSLGDGVWQVHLPAAATTTTIHLKA